MKWRRYITGEGLQILTYTRQSLPLSTKRSLAWYTYMSSDTGQPFIRSSLKTRDTHTFWRAFGSEAVISCFYDLGLSRVEFEH